MLLLKALNGCSNPLGCLPPGVVNPDELIDGHPTQVTEAMITRLVECPQHDGPELKLGGNHGHLV
jgi:hypothetical protein